MVDTTVTRSNLHGLTALGRWLAERGVAGWGVTLARTSDSRLAKRTLPSLGLAAPRVLHALEAARSGGVEPFVRAFPLCVLGPFARWTVPPGEAGSAPTAEPCDDCAARAACPGISPLQRSRFGVSELRPLAAAVARDPSPPRDLLAAALATSRTSVE